MARRKESSSSVEDRALMESLIGDESLWAQFQRIGPLTPQKVTAAIQSADGGRPAELIDLVHELRQKDGHFHSVMQTRELGVSGLQWDIVAPEGATNRDKKAAAECKAALLAADGFQDAAAHWIGEGNLFGFAFVETIWKKTADSRLWPSYFKRIGCRRFGFRTADGRLLFDPNGGWGNVNVDGIDLVEQYGAAKFLRFMPRVNGDVLCREGLGRIMAWLGMFRTWDIGDWMQFAELAWKPKRVGKYQKNASKEDKAVLKTMLERLTSTGVAMIPETVELVINWAQVAAAGKASVHRELAEFLGKDMSKAALGQTDTVEPGENGARAATQVRNEVRKDIREADAVSAARMVTSGYCRSFIEFNYGTRVKVPEFFWLTEDPLNIQAFAEAIQKLRVAGFRIPESYVQDKTGIPAPKPDDILLGDRVDKDGKRIPPAPPPDPNAPPPPADGSANQDQQGQGAGAAA